MSGAANPRRLTPFEHYMLADDRAAYPMDFFLRFGFDAPLDRLRLERSLADTAAAQPLLTSTVRRARGQWVWNPGSTAPRLRRLIEQGCPNEKPFPRIETARQSGLQAWLDDREEASQLWLQVHHCCADAVGVLKFFRLWLQRYEELDSAANLRESESSNQRAETNAWEQRFKRCELSPWRYLSPSRQERRRLVGFAMNRPRRILVPGGDRTMQGRSAPRPTLASRRIALTRQIWQAAKSRLPVPASLNDVLLAGLFRALANWNDQLAGAIEPYCLRIAMPMDLRAALVQQSPAMNNVSVVFLDRSAHEIRAPHDLLAGIHQETSWIKQNHGAFVLHDVLRTLQRLPGGIESLVAPITCTTSAVLSNLGELAAYLPHEGHFFAGQARLVGLDFLPPIRPGTLAAFGVASYAGQLHISMHYDGQRMRPALAENLLSRVVGQWSGLLGV